MSLEYTIARRIRTALAEDADIAPHLLPDVLNPSEQTGRLEESARVQEMLVAVTVQPAEPVAPEREGFPSRGYARAVTAITILAKRELNESAHEAVCTMQDRCLRVIIDEFANGGDTYCPELSDLADVDTNGTRLPADMVGRQFLLSSTLFFSPHE